MANDYSGYSYARTLQFFEAYYPYDTEDVHYADVVLSMNQCKSIDEMLPILERIKKKIEKINKQYVDKIPDELSKELALCVSSVLSWNTACFDRLKTNLRSDVGDCYDDNIVRLFRENDEITTEICGECFVNLSHCWDNSKQKDLIIREAKEKANLDVTILFNEIKERKELLSKHCSDFRSFKVGMNGYQSAKQAVIDDLAFLQQYNWRMSSDDKLLYRDFQSKVEKEKKEEEKRNNKVDKSFENKSPIRESTPQAESNKKEDKKYDIAHIAHIIGVVLVLLIVIFFIAMCSRSCEGSHNPDDHTLENWILLILALLCFLK